MRCRAAIERLEHYFSRRTLLLPLLVSNTRGDCGRTHSAVATTTIYPTLWCVCRGYFGASYVVAKPHTSTEEEIHYLLLVVLVGGRRCANAECVKYPTTK